MSIMSWLRREGLIRKALEGFDSRAGVENDGCFIRSDPARTREFARCGATGATFRSDKQAFGGPNISDRLDHLSVGDRESYSPRFTNCIQDQEISEGFWNSQA